MLHEIKLFLLGIESGILMAVVFDLLRAFRKSKVHAEWAVAIEDLLFWFFVAGMIFGLVECYNKGVLRFYVFLGCVIGVIIYFLTITRLIFPLFLIVFKVVKVILSKCCLFFEIFKKIFHNLFILPLKKIWEGIKIVRNNI